MWGGETAAGAGNGRAASVLGWLQGRRQGEARALGSQLAGRGVAGPHPWGERLVQTMARRAAVMQPAAPWPALPAGLRPSFHSANTRVSLALSLPCVLKQEVHGCL